MPPQYNFIRTMVLIGDGGVGKTSLVSMYKNKFFADDYKLTIGVDILTKLVPDVKGPDEKIYDVMLQTKDIGGQARFAGIRDIFYMGANGALLVYDITRYKSYEHMENWLDELRHGVEYGKVVDVPVVVIGNKVDLEEVRAVSREEAQAWAEERGFGYVETSAKDDVGVDGAFRTLTEKMVHASLSARSPKEKRVQPTQ